VLVFGRRYLNTRDTFILPLKNYVVPENKLDFNNIKYVITNKIKYTGYSGGRKYELYFDKDELSKALLGDIEYFYTRSIVQYVNLKKTFTNTSPCWNVVGQYYFSFFSATTLLRLVHRGNTYLNKGEADKLSTILTTFHGMVQVEPGNYKFLIKNTANVNELCLELTPASNTHEQTWITINDFINELLINKKSDEEYTVLTGLKAITKQLKAQFPSMLRNRVNYQGKYGLDSITNNLHSYNILENDLEYVIKELLKFEKKDNESYEIKISTLYGYFYFIYATKLYLEYLGRVSTPSTIVKKRKEYLKQFETELPSFPSDF
jgi:hypothetical protein